MRNIGPFFLLLSALGPLCPSYSAQTVKTQPPSKGRSAKPSMLSSERAFNDLLAAHDQGVMSLIDRPNAYVCFHEEGEDFVIASFGPVLVDTAFWTKTAEGNRYFDDGVSFAEFRKGNQEDSGVSAEFVGRWWAYSFLPNSASFQEERSSGDDGDRTSVSVDDVEFRVVEEFRNKAADHVSYNFTLRRSTGRFLETYTIKSANASVSQEEYSGRCSIYKGGKKASTTR